jgi:hypothetical protein
MRRPERLYASEWSGAAVAAGTLHARTKYMHHAPHRVENTELARSAGESLKGYKVFVEWSIGQSDNS